MKRVLLLVNRPKQKYQLLVQTGKNSGLEVVIGLTNQIMIDYQAHQPLITVGRDKLTDFDLIYFRAIVKNLELQHVLALACRNSSTLIYDQPLKQVGPYFDGKNFDSYVLRQAGLPLVPSLLITKSNLTAAQVFNFPIVVKITNGSKGRGVFLCHNQTQLAHRLKTNRHLLVQPFIKNHGDIRLLVLGGCVISAIKRTRVADGEFRNNLSLGGKATLHQATPREKSLAVQATKALNYCIAGVDLIFDSQEKKWKILEVNRAPEFDGLMRATGIDVPQKIMEFFARELNDPDHLVK